MSQIRRVPHCSHWGTYTLLVQNGQIIGIEPSVQDPNPSPIIHSVTEWTKPERRILSPRVREGWLNGRDQASRRRRGQDRFVPVSWEEATELVAGEIRRVARERGNEAIFAGSYGWASCGRFHHAPTLLKRMLNLVGGFTGHVDTYSYAAGPVILRHVLGSDEAVTGRATTLDTVAEHGETLLVFGALSPRTAQIEAGGLTRRTFEQNLRRIVARGVKIIHVSPVQDDMPAWAGAEWWPIRPNTDTALLLGLAGEVVKSGAHDSDFLQRYCSGSRPFLAYLEGSEDGVEKNAAWAAQITGLKADAIRALARRTASTRTLIAMGWSLQRARHGEQPYWAALALAAVTGQIGLPGGGVGYGYGCTGGNGGPISVGKNPAISAGQKALDSFIPVARIADMLLHPGDSYSYAGETCTYPHIDLVYWAGGNPFHHHQDLNRLHEAFTRPTTIIVQDPCFTATARRADILLPASSSLERNDIAANGRSDTLVAMHKAIEPLGQARSDFDICAGIARALGVGDAFTEGRSEMEWLRLLYEQARTENARNFDHPMPTFDQFWQQGWAESPAISHYTYLADYRADPDAHPLKTESGRIVLTSDKLAKLNYSDCPAHPTWIEPEEWLGAAQGQDQFHLLSHQPAGRLHSQLETGATSQGDKRRGRETLRLSLADAQRLGIASGDTLKVSSPRGACLATALPDEKVRQGVLVLPTGAWLTQDGTGLDLAGNPNVVTADIPASRFSQGCAAHTCFVSLTRIDEQQDEEAAQVYVQQLSDLLSPS